MTTEVLASPDIPRKIRYAIFGVTIDDATAFDVYLIRSDDPRVFITRRPTLEQARSCIASYLAARASIISRGYRP